MSDRFVSQCRPAWKSGATFMFHPEDQEPLHRLPVPGGLGYLFLERFPQEFAQGLVPSGGERLRAADQVRRHRQRHVPLLHATPP